MQKMFPIGSHHLVFTFIKEFAGREPLGIQSLEISHNFIDTGQDCKGMGITANDISKHGHLCLVDHTNQNIGLSALVHTLCRDQCGAVPKLLDDLISDLLRVIGDDLASDSTAATLHQSVRYRTGKKTI